MTVTFRTVNIPPNTALWETDLNPGIRLAAESPLIVITPAGAVAFTFSYYSFAGSLIRTFGPFTTTLEADATYEVNWVDGTLSLQQGFPLNWLLLAGAGVLALVFFWRKRWAGS